MTTVMSNNVIKISTSKSPAKNIVINSESRYPKTCDYCRDIFNSEYSYKRHKETGKCFRFCRLREEKRLQRAKTPKTSIYPRRCNKCSKVYKNKHSYYKHKRRCVGGSFDDDDVNNDDEFSNAADDDDDELVSVDVDVVEVDGNSIENIPVTDNKENIDDITSNFILTLDVDKNFSDDSSLYPRICELCHKVFKTQDQFEMHKANTKCSGIEVRKKPPQPIMKVNSTSIHYRRCGNCNKVINHKQLYNNHIKRCGKVLSTVAVLKQAFDFVPVAQPTLPPPTSDSRTSPETNTQSSYSKLCNACGVIFGTKRSLSQHSCPAKSNSPETDATNGMYPRTCDHCNLSFRSKWQFYRHKAKCAGYQDSALDKADDSYVSCDYCLRKFQTYLLYTEHVKTSHPEVKVIQMPVKQKYKYPRKCLRCFVVYSTAQTFCNHKKKCALRDPRSFDGEFSQDPNAEIGPESRTCKECFHTYSNRQSFCNHRARGLCQKFAANKMYPRRCEFCSNIYSSKQTYHHHKIRCPNFGKEEARRVRTPMYPRTCNRCNRTFAYKQVYYKHQKACENQHNTTSVEDEIDDSSVDHTDLDYEPLPTSSSYTPKMYPRMCEFCRKTYANRHSFSKHKPRCVPVSPVVNITEDADTSAQISESSFYPRECENCLGTFQNAATFNAHKIRCDFFETKVNESDFRSYIKSSCEHCRNIVNQYRRIFHQHLEQCTDPIIVTPYPPLITQREPQPQPKRVSNILDESSICDCCGLFFETREEIELHKKSFRVPEDTAVLECGVCMETFDSKEEAEVHKARCILNVSNKTYPRFCECCRKIYKTKQTFYNHKKNCHVHCLKYFVLKDCDNCKLPFKCEKMYMEHVQKCVPLGDADIAAECEVSVEPMDEQILGA
ncbi:zinc finger protein 91-like [Planococcus citri]|uniref:zinc finger protein 91-like n=1 Tax=Planococcus citri TaxID=170843 RepID=UPI0031F7C771